MDTSPAAYLWNTANITNQSAFNILLATTMREAAATAAIGTPGGKKFAVKEANFTAFQKLYTLVQCTPDLSSSDCSRCLETAISQLPTCCGGKQGGRVLTASCIIRYEIYPFYNASAVEVPSSPPPSSPEIPPPPPTGSVTGSGGGISTATIIAIVAPIYVSVLLFGLGCIFLRRRAKKKYNTIPGDSLVDGDGLHKEKFSKWRNGVGTFHESARIDPTALIEIGAIIHPKAIVGPNVHVGSGAVIGPAVTLGHSTKIGYNVCLSNCTVGDSCVIHNGVCIGQDGFGFYVNEQGSMVKKPQLLNARIGNHVEIGANTCIDRGSWRDTVIGDHSKIDNLVQIGHNVVIGESCMLCGQVGIAGSVTIGDYVTLGGRVAVRDHVSIASKVRLAANSCVTKDIREPGDYGGFPAVPVHEWRRQVATYSRI